MLVPTTATASGTAALLSPVGLSAAHAQQLSVLGDRDGIAFHVLHTAPGKL